MARQDHPPRQIPYSRKAYRIQVTLYSTTFPSGCIVPYAKKDGDFLCFFLNLCRKYTAFGA